MKRILKIVLIVGSISALWFVPWVLVKAWIKPLPDSIQEQVNEAVENGFEGLVVYVDEAGKPPVIYTGGWHNRTKEIPAEEDAYFKIGSIAKLYTATAIAKLVSAERLSLSKTLVDYMPELEGRIENAEMITLKMLVRHRSGIPNYTDTPDYWAHPKETFEENLNLIIDKPANFEPGEEYEYCNTNYLLLKKIMDKELGYTHFLFIREEILDPLGLNSTFASVKDVNSDDVMSGYHKGHKADLKYDDIGMIATAKDVGMFLRAMNTGDLFTESERKIYSSIYIFEHAGWVPGYQSFATYQDEIDAVIIAFYNTTDPDLILWNLAEIYNSRFAKIIEREGS